VTVVRELVVVPDDKEGEALVRLLQVGVGAVGAVELTVVVEARGGPEFALGAGVEEDGAFAVVEGDGAVGRGRLEGGVARGFIDVVAEVDDEVELLAVEAGVGVVVLAGEVLAGDEGEADGGVGVGGRRVLLTRRSPSRTTEKR
jgi:hypothetical protein